MTPETTTTKPRQLVIHLPEHFLLRRRLRVLSIPSANTFVSWNRSRAFHRFTELKRLYCQYILVAKLSARWRAPAKRVEVEIVRRCARLFDDDNAVGGAKYLRDSLVRMGLVVDDSSAHLTLTVRQNRAAKGARGVTVLVREVRWPDK